MKQLIILLALAAMLAGCRASKPVPSVSEIVRDSIVVKKEVVYRDTTVFVTLPQSHQQNVLIDTSKSRLENETSVSYAYLQDGKLKHTLDSKKVPMKIYLPKIIKETSRDTVRIRGQDVVKTVTVKVNELTGWQRLRLHLFNLFAAVICAFIAYKVVIRK